MKKIVSLLLAMMMVVAMCAGAMAESATPTTYSITIENAATGHTYEAYQIFAGDLNEEETVLSNIVWGSGISDAGKTALGDASTYAASLTEANIVAQAKILEGYLSTTIAGSANNPVDGKYVISGLTAGYYLIKDKDNSLTNVNDTYTRFILQLIDDTTMAPKSAAPSSQKKVKDTDDTTGVTTDWQDSADWDIGDAVPFQLTAKLPTNYADYTKYQLTFHDKQSAGLTFNEDSVKVYVDGALISNGYTVVTEGLNDGCTFEVKFADLKTVTAAVAGSEITVEYTATLNENAVLGSAGNPNTSYITYSNNPNNEQGGEEGKTPEDKVIVFTYKVVVNKVDQNEKPLAGAEFKLEKQIAGKAGADPTWSEIAVVKNTDGTVFTFTGLDDGFYRLTETATPDGYNSIEPIYFKVEATHTNDDAGENALKLTALTATVTDKDGKALTDTTAGLITFKPNEADGSLTTDVVNKAGATLPETGGMGTTMMYIGGGLLVAFAVIMLATKRRMNAAE